MIHAIRISRVGVHTLSLQRRFKKPVPVTIPTPASKQITGIHAEQHYSVIELAKLWAFSEPFIRHIFINEPGVIKIVRAEDVRNRKRRYVSLRIPANVAARVHERLHGKVA